METTKEPVNIASLINNLVNSKNWRRNLNRNTLFEFWDQAVGKDIAAHAQPNVIRGEVLWVCVTDSVWMQQLHLQKQHLLEVLNRRLGDDGISDIRFNMVGKLPQVYKKKSASAVKKKRKKEPDPQKLAGFKKMLAAVVDEPTRQSMLKIWLAQQDRD